jgi:RNA polymerase sigma factor (sigma-70 family)
MNKTDWLTGQFEACRPRLQAVAYRMLGSQAEADDAVQEAWLRLSRTGADGVENLAGWLTTVVARIALDMLRLRNARREDSLEARLPGSDVGGATGSDPEQEQLLAESVGLAVLVVLDTLAPAERVAFVLHDMFDLSFDEIAAIVGREPAAARQLASRARRRIRGAPTGSQADLARQREAVNAYLAAVRGGDLQALLAVLDPDVVLHADSAAVQRGATGELHGAQTVSRSALAAGRGARAARLALVDGTVGVVVAPQGRLLLVLKFNVVGGKIAEIDVMGEPARLNQLALGVLSD